MTREEAIKVLNSYRQMLVRWLEEDVPAFDVAIESLSAEPCKSTEQKSADVPSGDLISRADVVEMFANMKVEETNLPTFIENLNRLPSADRPTLKQTDTMIIADALRYLVKDTERHELDRTRAEELREQILQYGASMCHSADRPKGEWIEKGGELVCSVCGNSVSFSRTSEGWVLGKFCQSCGADMRCRP